MNTITHLSRRCVAGFQSVVTREQGSSMVEYAMLVSLLALVAFIAVATFGDALGNKNQGIAGSIQDATNHG